MLGMMIYNQKTAKTIESGFLTFQQQKTILDPISLFRSDVDNLISVASTVSVVDVTTADITLSIQPY